VLAGLRAAGGECDSLPSPLEEQELIRMNDGFRKNVSGLSHA
jgi:hypothetical protein